MTLCIGERYRDKIAQSLAAQGVDVLWLPDNPDISPDLAGHADLSLLYIGNHLIVAKGIYSYIVNFLTNTNYPILESALQGTQYPDDAGLCVCTTGRYTIYNPKTVDPTVIPYLTGTKIPVRQGYTKCSVCAVSGEAIITSDDAIGCRAAEYGLDVLKITPGYVRLDGYDYGFIGGASFLLNQNTLAFTGTLDAHPDKPNILAFLQKHGVQPVFLTADPVFDIGGAVALP